MVTAFVIAKCTPMPLTLRHSELDSESQINITQIDAESTFVTSACECGVAVWHDRFRKVLDIKPTPDGGNTEINFGLHYQQNLSENPWCGGNRTFARFARSAQMDFQPYFASRCAQN